MIIKKLPNKKKVVIRGDESPIRRESPDELLSKGGIREEWRLKREKEIPEPYAFPRKPLWRNAWNDSEGRMEARAGIEPANRGFAVPGITTLLPRHLAKRRKVLTTESSRKQKPCLVSPNHYKFSISEYRFKIIN